MSTMSELDTLDLSRTAAAMKVYNELYALINFEHIKASYFLTYEIISMELDTLEKCSHAVAAAFALDTADRNPPENCKNIRPGVCPATDDFLKRIIEKFKSDKGRNEC